MKRALATALTTAVVATAAIVGVAAPAQAVESEVAGATLDWGLKQSFRNYVINMVTDDGRIETSGDAAQPGGGANGFEWRSGAGTVDPDAATGEASFSGGVRFVKHGGLLDVELRNPRIVMTGTSGTIYMDATATNTNGELVVDDTDLAFATLSAAAPAVDETTVTWSNVEATLTADGARGFAGFYSAGESLDPLTITLPYEAPAEPAVETTTTLSASADAVELGETVRLTAAVAPAAEGTVEFFDDGAPIGDENVADGAAAITTPALTAGEHSFTAAFTPADPEAFIGSTSSATIVTVEAAAEVEYETGVSLEVLSDAPALLGDEVTLTATVANLTDEAVSPAGSVQFFSTRAGAEARTSLGSATVTAGVAELTTTRLAAGGHSFEASFRATSGEFGASDSEPTGNVGIVDTSAPEPYVPGAGAQVSDESATASWAWSAYASGWDKFASGDIAVEGDAFALSNGTVTADDGGAVIDFSGALRTEAYGSFFPEHGQWVELVDPALHITSDGEGVWVAGVRTGVADYAPSDAGERTVVGTFTGVDGVGAGTAGARVVSFDYDGATAQGTWHADYANAWPNAFVAQIPSMIQAFYYQSGESPGNLNKPASDLTVDFAWPVSPEEPVQPTLRFGSSSLTQGDRLVVRGSGFEAGERVTAAVHSEPVDLGAFTAGASGSLSVTWDIPRDFEAGQHTLVVTRADGSTVSGSFAVAAAPDAVIAPPVIGSPATASEPEDACVARSISGGSLTWGVKESFRSYITGPIAHGSASNGGFFRLANGSGAYNPDENRGRVDFTGSVHYTGHSGILDMTLSNPSIQITGPDRATLHLTVDSSGYGSHDAVRARVAFANISLGADSGSADRPSWSGASATLTAAGANAFMGFYNAGDALDSLSLTLPLAGEVECDSTTSAELAATGGEPSLAAAWLGLGLLALGAGAFVWQRRRAVGV